MINNQLKKTTMLALMITTALANVSYVSAAEEVEQLKTREIVVTASRTEQEIKDAPASVEVITRTDLDNMGAESLAQALQLATGINVLENGMVGNSFSIRGMKNNQSLIMVDGRRIRTEDTDQTANAYELQRYNIADIERIEIVRGATSSLYGADAMGGVINIITRGTDVARATISGDWTTRQSDAGFNYASGKEGKWSFGASFKFSKIRERVDTKIESSTSEGMIPTMPGMVMKPYTVVKDSRTDTSNIFGNKHFYNFKAKYDITNNKHLDFLMDYMDENTQYFTDGSGSNTYTFAEAVVPMFGMGSPASTVWVRPQGGDASYKIFNKKRTTGSVKYSGTDKLGDYMLRYSFTKFSQLDKTFVNGEYNDFEDSVMKQHIFEGKRTQQAGDKHLLTYGGEYRTEYYDGTKLNSGGNLHTVTVDGKTKEAADTALYYSAAYIQDEWMPSDNWIIIPSLRLDHNNRFGNKLTYKLGSTFIQNDDLRWKLNVGTAYRAPAASEMFFDFAKTPMPGMNVKIAGNPDLRPEQSLNFDFGLEWNKNKTSLKATYFHNDVKDMIDYVEDTGYDEGLGHYYYKYQNISRAKISGLEFDATQRFSDQWKLRAAYNYMDARNGEDVALTGRYRHKTSFQLGYTSPDRTFTSTLWYDWFSGYKNSSTNDACLGICNVVFNKKITANANIYFGINNIFNKTNGLMGYDGRVWRAGFNLSF
ncbi:MAG: TonB-dependent receptor [Anaerovibrio sp.]|uniref:TonB-dependent receptor plug domain-containing protein n=1 Tax=Anaerovibrio sp. TaxID=1872532 RepID=UPI0025BA4E57|nr:TonB-dependent receptor [Anaerovibrio sp.]MBE6098513.1 TonB-dependent receptor [Anaerovibrio sp.]